MQLSDGSGLPGWLPAALSDLALALILVPAALGDYRHRRISNRLVLAGILVAFSLRLLFFPPGAGLWAGLSGLLVGFGMLLPFYILRGMAAGDVKLMAMVGAFLGPQLAFWAVVATFLVGGVWAVVVVSRRHLWPQIISNFRDRQLSVMSDDGSADAEKVGSIHPRSVGRLPYGVAIAAGSLAVVMMQRMAVISG